MTRSYQATNARPVRKRWAIRPSTTSRTTHRGQTRPSRRTILGHPRARRGRLIRKLWPTAPTPRRTTNEVGRGPNRGSGLRCAPFLCTDEVEYIRNKMSAGRPGAEVHGTVDFAFTGSRKLQAALSSLTSSEVYERSIEGHHGS